MFEDFNLLVDSFLRPTVATSINFQPSCDVSETKDHFLVSFDMPGVKKEDVKIEVQGNQLLISGERQRTIQDDNGESTLHHERMYGRFERAFTLPSTIATDKIEAHYENGVLNIACQKLKRRKLRQFRSKPARADYLTDSSVRINSQVRR
jgi:HSP20 family protein